jgi:hypothetical protein
MDRIWLDIFKTFKRGEGPQIIYCSQSFLDSIGVVINAPWYRRLWWKIRYAPVIDNIVERFSE